MSPLTDEKEAEIADFKAAVLGRQDETKPRFIQVRKNKSDDFAQLNIHPPAGLDITINEYLAPQKRKGFEIITEYFDQLNHIPWRHVFHKGVEDESESWRSMDWTKVKPTL